MITTFRYRAEEKGLGGLFERFPKSKNRDAAPSTERNRIPIAEPNLDSPSTPPDRSTPLWLV